MRTDDRYQDDPVYREQQKARSRARYRRIRAAAAAASAEWNRTHPERRKATLQRFHAAHPDRGRTNRAKRRALQREAWIEHVEPLVLLERDDGVCGICGEDVDPMRYDVDHIVPLALGGEHSYANTQPAHVGCNRSKQAFAA